MKGEKELSSGSLLRNGLGKASLGLRQEGVKVLVAGNLAFLPQETGGIGPKAAVCSVCDALEKPSVPSATLLD